MSVDSRTTPALFKAEGFWNGFGIFATYEHTNLLRDAVSAHMNAYVLKVNAIVNFEKELNDAIGFIRLVQEAPDSSVEQKIGEAVDQLNLRHQMHTFKFVDLESDGLLVFLENSREMPKRELKQTVHELLALQQMRDAMDEALNEGINRFDEEEELERVKRILHQEFSMSHVEHLVSEARAEPLTDAEIEEVKNEAISNVASATPVTDMPLFRVIFDTVESEKRKLGIE